MAVASGTSAGTPEGLSSFNWPCAQARALSEAPNLLRLKGEMSVAWSHESSRIRACAPRRALASPPAAAGRASAIRKAAKGPGWSSWVLKWVPTGTFLWRLGLLVRWALDHGAVCEALQILFEAVAEGLLTS